MKTNAKRKARAGLACGAMVCGLLTGATNVSAQFRLLHEFAGGPNDGWRPNDSLTLSGSTLYGMTERGLGRRQGTVFRINTDGTGYQVLQWFSGGANSGARPNGSLTLSGSTLYGMTPYGGAYNMGTVFRMNTDGTDYQVLHSFAGGANDGKYPSRSLALLGSTLYGMTSYGGDNDWGTVFRINTDGTGYQVLHEFGSIGNDGARPLGSLTVSGSTLYGMTAYGGKHEFGTVFRMNADGTGYQVLFSFDSELGFQPSDSLTVSGSTLYGMTTAGGLPYGVGTVFRMNSDGTGYQVLHYFEGGSNDGWAPRGSLTLSGSTLYGMTYSGGDNNLGTVFQINTDGTGYRVLHEFTGSKDDGQCPYGSLTLSGSTLYGMTGWGGDYDLGTVFALEIPEPTSLVLLAMGWGLVLSGRRRGMFCSGAPRSPRVAERACRPTSGTVPEERSRGWGSILTV